MKIDKLIKLIVLIIFLLNIIWINLFHEFNFEVRIAQMIIFWCCVIFYFFTDR